MLVKNPGEKRETRCRERRQEGVWGKLHLVQEFVASVVDNVGDSVNPVLGE